MRMASVVPRLLLLAAAVAPQANATVAAGGAVIPRSQPLETPKSQRKRRQLVGAMGGTAPPPR